MWIWCAAGKVNASCGKLYDEEQVVSDEATLGPDFDGSEINGTEDLPVGFQESPPGSLSLTIWRGLNAVGFQDVADGRVRDLMANIGQSTLDSVVPPAWILSG